jgi:RNA polymerase sigma-70 factor (sigma-E family)
MAAIADEDEFAEYAANALPRLRRIAFLLCQDWHRADDLTQSALTRLYLHWRRAKAAENPDAYLGAILMNVYLSEQRTSWWKRTSVRSEPTEAAPAAWAGASGGAGGHHDQLEDLLDLRAALQTLPPRRRATIVLRYYCDYSVEQTAQLLGCSPGTVKSQTSKALTQLRDVLEPDGADVDAEATSTAAGTGANAAAAAAEAAAAPPETAGENATAVAKTSVSFHAGPTTPGRTQ